jgi:hypothetical protein
MAVRRLVVSTMASTLVLPFRAGDVNHAADLVSVCKTSDLSVFRDPTGTMAPWHLGTNGAEKVALARGSRFQSA